MTSVTTRGLRRTSAGILASTLVLSGAAVAAPSVALGDTGFELARLGGEDRYGTAAVVARSTFTTADDVVLASGAAGHYPDALTANYLAGVSASPILLTASEVLPAVTLETMRQLRVRRVFVVGGTTAVSGAVEAELRSAGYTVERLGGSDRYVTAATVIRRVGSATSGVGSIAGARTAILATGGAFPDILAAAPLSYSHQLPLMITQPDALPGVTRDLLRSLRITRVVVVGGTSTVSGAVEAQLRALDGVTTVTRLAGADRFGTAAAVADFAISDLGYERTHVHLARGDDFADALAGGPHSGREKAAILLTSRTGLSDVTRAWLEANSVTLTDGHILGGVAAVSADVAQAALAAGRSQQLRVLVTSTSVVAGGVITGTVIGDVSTATASGCGLTAVAVGQDSDTSTVGRQFTLPVPAGLTAGPCTLTITLVPAGGGAAVTRTVQLSVTAAPTPPAPSPVTRDTSAPTLAAQAAAPAADDTTVTFQSDEPLLGSSVAPSDFHVTGGASQAVVQDVAVSASGTTITVTTSPLLAGNVVTLSAGAVTDLAANAGPATDVHTAAATGTQRVAQWRMEDAGRTMVDATGRGHDGTSSDSVLVQQPGAEGAGYRFPETPSYVTVPDAPDLDPGDGAFSVTVSVRFTGRPAGQDVDGVDQSTYDIIRKGLGTTSGGNYKLEILSSGVAHCLFGGSGGTRGVTSDVPLDDDQWHTITCGRTADRVVLVVDGRVYAASASTGTIDNAAALILGARSTHGDDQYLGLLDEVEVSKG